MRMDKLQWKEFLIHFGILPVSSLFEYDCLHDIPQNIIFLMPSILSSSFPLVLCVDNSICNAWKSVLSQHAFESHIASSGSFYRLVQIAQLTELLVGYWQYMGFMSTEAKNCTKCKSLNGNWIQFSPVTSWTFNQLSYQNPLAEACRLDRSLSCQFDSIVHMWVSGTVFT